CRAQTECLRASRGEIAQKLFLRPQCLPAVLTAVAPRAVPCALRSSRETRPHSWKRQSTARHPARYGCRRIRLWSQRSAIRPGSPPAETSREGSATPRTVPTPFSSEWPAGYTRPRQPHSCRCPASRSYWRRRCSGAHASAEWRAYLNLNDREKSANREITRACEKPASLAAPGEPPKKHRRRAKSSPAQLGAYNEGMAAPCNTEWDISAESRRKETPPSYGCESSATAQQNRILRE